MEDGAVGASRLGDAKGDVVEAQAFKDGEAGFADRDFTAEQFGEVIAGHLTNALGIGEPVVGDDDGAQGKKEREHSPAPGGGQLWPQGVTGSPGAVKEAIGVSESKSH